MNSKTNIASLAILALLLTTVNSFAFSASTRRLYKPTLANFRHQSALQMARGYSDRKANSATIKSKRQNRVGETVRSEIAQILFNGYEVKVSPVRAPN